MTYSRNCRDVLKYVLRRAYTLNVKNPDCGFAIPLRVVDLYAGRDTRLKFATVERCIAAVWPHFVHRYIGNYKRIVYVLGISLSEFKERAGLS